MISKRYELLDQKNLIEEKSFKKDLESLDFQIEEQKQINLINEATLINEVRRITKDYQGYGEIFLGGGAMIAHDTIKMIQQDLFTFGVAVFFMFVLILSDFLSLGL